MALARPFRGFRFPARVILWAVRRHSRFAASLRDLERMLADRGVWVDHVPLHRRVQRFAPETEPRTRPHPRPVARTWRVEGTHMRVGAAWHYLHRAVDEAGKTAEFLPSATRDAAAARRFLAWTLGRGGAPAPRLAVTDRLASHRTPIGALARDGRLPEPTRHLRGRWLNDWIGQGHRRNRRRTRPMPGFKGFATARRALAGGDTTAMLTKGQVRGAGPGDASARGAFVLRSFGVAA